MELLRTHYANELETVEKEITDTFALIKPFIESENFKAKMAVLRKNMETLNKDIARRKENKFQRDSMAFNTGKAYKWKKTEGNPPEGGEKDSEKNNNIPTKKQPKTKYQKSKQTSPEEDITIPEDIDTSSHLILPPPRRTSQYTRNQDMTQLSTYSMDEEFQNLMSVPKQKSQFQQWELSIHKVPFRLLV